MKEVLLGDIVNYTDMAFVHRRACVIADNALAICENQILTNKYKIGYSYFGEGFFESRGLKYCPLQNFTF